MNFIFSVNQTPAAHPYAVFQLKTALKEAGWTVPWSSDGVERVGAGDRLIVPGTGVGGLANPRASFVLRQPLAGGPWAASRRELCFQGSGSIGWRVKYARSPFSGGGLVKSPSAPDEQFVLGGSSDDDPHFEPWFPINGDGRYRYNVVAQRESPFGFWAGGFGNGGGDPGPGVLLLDPLLLGSFALEDPDPMVLYASATGHTLTAEHLGGSDCPRGFLREAFVPTPALTWATATGGRLAPGGLRANAFTGKDELLPIPYGRGGYKGISTLMRWIGSNRTTGTALSHAGTRDLIVYRHVALPWDGSLPLV